MLTYIQNHINCKPKIDNGLALYFVGWHNRDTTPHTQSFWYYCWRTTWQHNNFCVSNYACRPARQHYWTVPSYTMIMFIACQILPIGTRHDAIKLQVLMQRCVRCGKCCCSSQELRFTLTFETELWRKRWLVHCSCQLQCLALTLFYGNRQCRGILNGR